MPSALTADVFLPVLQHIQPGLVEQVGTLDLFLQFYLFVFLLIVLPDLHTLLLHQATFNKGQIQGHYREIEIESVLKPESTVYFLEIQTVHLDFAFHSVFVKVMKCAKNI